VVPVTIALHMITHLGRHEVRKAGTLTECDARFGAGPRR